jgi:hypothetical protein
VGTGALACPVERQLDSDVAGATKYEETANAVPLLCSDLADDRKPTTDDRP